MDFICSRLVLCKFTVWQSVERRILCLFFSHFHIRIFGFPLPSEHGAVSLVLHLFDFLRVWAVSSGLVSICKWWLLAHRLPFAQMDGAVPWFPILSAAIYCVKGLSTCRILCGKTACTFLRSEKEKIYEENNSSGTII